jgi:hypothetical protein
MTWLRFFKLFRTCKSFEIEFLEKIEFAAVVHGGLSRLDVKAHRSHFCSRQRQVEIYDWAGEYEYKKVR